MSVIACGVCKAVHHDDCWEENGGCAVALCAGGPSFEAPTQQQAPASPPPQPAAPEPPPLPAVVAPDPSEAPTQKAARPPSTPAPPPPPTPPPGAPVPPGRPSRSRWVPLIAAAIVLLGGATATAIVLTKQDKGASDTATVNASETTPSSAEFEEDEFNEEGEFEGEESGFEEEEFEEEEAEEVEPPPSPDQLAQGQIQHALRAHFDNLASGDYEDAYYDLTSSEGEAIGGESAWVAAQEEDQLQSFNLAVDTTLYDAHSARATIIDFRTHALATGCNEWSGSWEMSKVYGEWLISAAELEKVSC